MRRQVWRSTYVSDATNWREWQAAWASHHGNYPAKEMRFPMPAVIITNLNMTELRQVKRLSFVRGKMPDWVVDATDSDEE